MNLLTYELLRLLYILAHRRTVRWFARSGTIIPAMRPSSLAVAVASTSCTRTPPSTTPRRSRSLDGRAWLSTSASPRTISRWLPKWLFQI